MAGGESAPEGEHDSEAEQTEDERRRDPGGLGGPGSTKRRPDRRGRWTAGGLGVAAVAVVGLSLAFGADQEPVAMPDAVPSPSPEDDERGPALGPGGLASLELGKPVDPKSWSISFERGCNRSLTGRTEELRRLGVGTGVRVETDGDEIVAVTLVERSRSVAAPGTLPDVWLGPTLGDPMVDAVVLPGAEVVEEDPRGDDGPGVTSVVVDTDAGQIVFSDPPYDQATPSKGRISHITVRSGQQVNCRLFDATAQLQPGEAVDPDAPVAIFDTGGTVEVRLGDGVAEAERAGLLLPDVDPPAPGTVPQRLSRCRSWSTTDGTGTVVLADEAGEIISVGSGGLGIRFETTFGLSTGQRADEAAALLGAEAPSAGLDPGSALDGVPVEGEIAPGVRATAVSYPQWLPIQTIDALLTGPLVVTGLTLHQADESPSPPC